MEKSSIYGLIGYPLGHSFSKSYFTDKFSCEGIEAEYHNFEIASIDLFPSVIESNPQLRGLNVTIPYKEQVMQFLDEVDEDALQMGAVNVVRVSRSGSNVRLKGFNSDVIGFSRSIKPFMKEAHRKALVLGTGGSSKAVVYGLHKMGVETKSVSRTPKAGMFVYDQITPELMSEYTVMVNCTPCGMHPHTEECPPLPYEAMDENTLLYDLVYNPDQTLFLINGAKHGAVVKNGLEMLRLQADAGWEFWNK